MAWRHLTVSNFPRPSLPCFPASAALRDSLLRTLSCVAMRTCRYQYPAQHPRARIPLYLRTPPAPPFSTTLSMPNTPIQLEPLLTPHEVTKTMSLLLGRIPPSDSIVLSIVYTSITLNKTNSGRSTPPINTLPYTRKPLD